MLVEVRQGCHPHSPQKESSNHEGGETFLEGLESSDETPSIVRLDGSKVMKSRSHYHATIWHPIHSEGPTRYRIMLLGIYI